MTVGESEVVRVMADISAVNGRLEEVDCRDAFYYFQGYCVTGKEGNDTLFAIPARQQ